MDNLLITLFSGVAIITTLFFVLLKLIKLSRLITSLVTLGTTTVIYLPLLLLDWPGPDVMAIQIAIYGLTIYILGLYAGRTTKSEQKQQWGWVPYAIIVFFVLLVIWESVFITLAQKGLDTSMAEKILPKPKSGGDVQSYFPGTVDANQARQQKHDKYSARQELKRVAHWQIKKGWRTEAVARQKTDFLVQILDNDKPVLGAQIDVQFLRGPNPSLDQQHAMTESSDGKYQVSVTLPEPGRWDVIIMIKKDKLQHEVRAHTTLK